VAKLGFTDLALAGCFTIALCVTSPGTALASAFKYPEAQTYVDCAVDHARKRAFDNPEWFKNDDLDVPISGGESDCEAEQVLFQIRARADDVHFHEIAAFLSELHDRVWRLAWDEVVRVRRERLKAMGAIR